MSAAEPDLVSVVIPVYRTEAFLDACVGSILDQTHPHLDVILVDDGSDDGAPDLCDRWAAADSRVRVVHQPNGGLSSARNTGLDIARGRFVTFVDSDDVCSPDMVARLLTLAVSHGADIAVCRAVQFRHSDPDFTSDEQVLPLSGRQALLHVMRQARGWEAWGRLFRRELLAPGLRFHEGTLYEDLEFTTRVLADASAVVFSTARLYGYRQRDDSIMGRSLVAASPQLVTVLEMNIEHARRAYGRDSVEYRELAAAFLMHATKTVEQMGGPGDLGRNAEFAAAYKPFMRRHLGELTSLGTLSRTYRLLMAASSFSPRAFVMLFSLASAAKPFVPGLRRGAPRRGPRGREVEPSPMP